ncbi:hybrid sensor histidine kinase/response regulator [Microvirga pakistanensis]|uniref:hybrid sensor histidine kinase/response regulator n=1 Tax=Microvirga pakistanensis TaxID=1682650 RepID=UPI00106CF883|nr:hybrid sensor histidine kinase/response regulator [Microvirga pakistanensis]
MDDLLIEFLTETSEHLDIVDVEMVRFEQDPNNQAILGNIFRLVHTIKGTCGFLGLPRLESLAHAAETLMGRFRDGMPVTPPAISLILATLDRIKQILSALERQGAEPSGSDQDLIGALGEMAVNLSINEHSVAAVQAGTNGTLPHQVLERELKPGEVSLDELEKAFREAPGPETTQLSSAQSAPQPPSLTRDALVEAKSGKAPEVGEREGASAKVQTIRVNVDTLEHLMTMVSELVLTRNQLLEIARRTAVDHGYKVPLQRLSQVTAELQEGVMKTRMQPIGNAWQKLPRVVRDLSNELSKQIDLVMAGADTELDRQVLDVIKDPLTHMVRNSADHGIESPADRRAAGKPEKGTIRLSAFHEGGSITIEIADDGRGLNFDAIRKKAVERGIASEAEAERISDAQVAKFIFHPGFSTAAKVTSVSGRGVGMDVVKTNIELIGGVIDIRSEQGRGSTFIIKIPLTLAIVSALIVAAKNQRFAVPQGSVQELVRVGSGSDHMIERINGTAVLRLRERLLPIIPLAKVMGLSEDDGASEGFVVVTQVGPQRFGIMVDEVFHTEEIVVKPMSSKLRHIPLFSGNTILGDGAVVLIVEPNGLARMIGSGSGDGHLATEGARDEAGSDEDSATTMLVFRGSGPALKALPLSLVTRLEVIDAAEVEWTGGRPLLQYRGRLMPIVPCDEAMVVKSQGSQSLIVFSDGDLTLGLAVEEIVDIVEDRLTIELVADRPDLIGSAVIRGRTTEVVNLAHYLPLVAQAWVQAGTSERRGRSVLLVDNSAFFREMLGPVLKSSGYKVHMAPNTMEAQQVLVSRACIDILVIDLDLLERSSFDLIGQLRGTAAHATIPVIGLTLKHDPQQVALARKLRVSELVSRHDRRGLLAALAESNPVMEQAA